MFVGQIKACVHCDDFWIDGLIKLNTKAVTLNTDKEAIYGSCILDSQTIEMQNMIFASLYMFFCITVSVSVLVYRHYVL
jgi:phosphotransferase system  glucose/maltose/N-acetylglucosamine-specific IIC component